LERIKIGVKILSVLIVVKQKSCSVTQRGGGNG
jgi:hypothetical protein